MPLPLKTRFLLGFVIILILIFWGGYFLKKRSQPDVKPPLEALPQDPFIQVYFNHSEATFYTEPYRQQTRLGDDLEKIIVDTVASATETIDLAVQELRLPQIAQALIEREKAGVKVRVILENNYSRPWQELSEAELAKLSDQDRNRYVEFVQLLDFNQDGTVSADEINQRDAIAMLANANIPLIDDTADGSKGTGLMHHKFIVVDGKTVIVSSANFTTSGIHGDFNQPESRGNANHLLKLESRDLAKQFTQEFNIMWGDGVGGQSDSKFGTNKPYRGVQNIDVGTTSVAIQFSPTARSKTWENSVNGLISKTLKTANQSIHFALFVFSGQRIADTMQTQAEKGVNIAGIIDPGFAYRYYSEGLDMMGVSIARKCKYEAENRPWKQPLSTVGIPKLLPGDKLHHKFSVIDNKVVITGSHNWTEAANTQNDETLLIIQNPIVTAHFQREFERLYQKATLGLPSWVMAKVKKELNACEGNIVTASPSSRWRLGYRVNINTATAAELESLPGVGPKLAQRIILARQQQPFTSLEDLQRVSGIGPKMVEKLQDLVTW